MLFYVSDIISGDQHDSEVPTVRINPATVNADCASPPFADHAIPTTVASTHGIDPISPPFNELQGMTVVRLTEAKYPMNPVRVGTYTKKMLVFVEDLLQGKIVHGYDLRASRRRIR
jgi:hypothetical protein